MYYVYIIQSEVDGTYYKGSTSDYNRRIEQHNLGLSDYTRAKIPWKLVHVEVYESKLEALKRERSLKKATRLRLESIINSSKNILISR